MFIGNPDGYSQTQFDGLIDEVSIYNRALTSVEVYAIFSVGSAGKCKTIGPVPPITVKVEADFQTVTRALDRPPLPGLNLWALGIAGALKGEGGDNTLLSAYSFASAAAFAAVSDGAERPRVRVDFPLERISYVYNPAVPIENRLDFGKGLLPILQLPGPQGTPISAEVYDDAAGMDDFLGTLNRLGLDVYITIDSLPRQPKGTDPSGCLASDPEAFSPLYPSSSLIRWNISPPKDYTEWSLLMEKMVAAHPNIKWWSIGNEPNLTPWEGDHFGSSWFWRGTQEQFFEFYDRTAEGLAREAEPGVEIGGYGDPFEGQDPWVSDFLTHRNTISPQPRLDFLSFHRYSCDPNDVAGAYLDVRGWLNNAGYPPKFPMVLEEFGLCGFPSVCPGRVLDDEAGSQYQAAFVAASLIGVFSQGVRDAFYFDIATHASATNDLVRFDFVPKENTCPIEGAYTDIENLEVKIKELTPVHQVFQVFDHLYQTVIPATSDQSDVQVLATKSGDGKIALVLSNFAANTKSTGLTINNVPASIYDVSEYMVDDTRITLGNGVVFHKANGNWNIEEGVESVRTLGRIQPHKKFLAQTTNDCLVTMVDLPPYTVALLVLEPNQPPVADAGPDQTIEGTSPAGASVPLNGFGSTDPDGDALTYTWHENSALIAGPTDSPTSPVTLCLGSHTIRLTVDDGKGGTDTDEVIINVVDTTPPPYPPTDFWVQTKNGLYGGEIWSLAINSRGYIFAGTYNTGVFRSTDNGDHWFQVGSVSNGLTKTNVRSLAINLSGEIFAGTWYKGVYRSTDNGNTWAQINSGLGLSSYYPQDQDLAVNALVINTSGVIFAGTGPSGVYRSDNNGNSWTQVNNGLTNTTVSSLAINTSGEIFAGTYNGVHRSADNGNSWTPVNSGLANLVVKSLAIDTSGYIFAGTMDGIYRSYNNGDSWTPVVTTGLPNTRVLSLAIKSSGEIFTGTISLGVYRSQDHGDSWTRVNNDLTNTSVMSLAIKSSGEIFAGTSGGGVYRSTNNGNNWTQINTGLTNTVIQSLAINTTSGGIFAGTYGTGVFRSIDNGNSWTQVNNGLTYDSGDRIDPYVFTLAINTSGEIFAGTFGGVYRSDDNGDRWTRVNNGLTYTYVRSLAINTISGNIFAGTDGGGVFLSTNNGENWKKVNGVQPTGLTNLVVHSLAINTSGNIYAGTVGGGVFRSTGNGNSWTPVNTGLTNLVVKSLAINTGGYIFAGTDGGGVFLSTDNGNNWSQVGSVNSGLKCTHVFSLAINTSGVIFAGTYGWLGGVYRSDNNGDSWTQVNSGLTYAGVWCLAIKPSGYIFAGTESGGVYRGVIAPSPPTLASPSDSKTGISVSPTLSWNASGEATSYGLQVDDNNDFSSPIYDQSALTSTSQLVSGLNNNTTYYWRVNATYAGGTSAWSNAWSFTTVVAPPALASPSDAATNQPICLTLSWNPSSGTTSYGLQVSTSSTFSTIIFDISTITSTSQQIGLLAKNTTYYWRVNAKNDGGTSDWSNAWSFTVSAQGTLEPGKLAIYYGFPSAVNGSATNLDAAANEFNKYDIVILGNSLQFPQYTGAPGQIPDYGCIQNSHYDHNNTVGIISRLNSMGGTAVYGYVSIGGENTAWICSGVAAPLTMAEIKSHVDSWATMGVAGIFFDEAEYGFGCSRARQNEAVDYVHSKGLSVFINGWNPDEIFKAEVVGNIVYTTGSRSGTSSTIPMNPTGAATHLSAVDLYLMESFQIINGNYQDTGDWVSRSEKALAYKAQLGTRIATVTTPTPNKTYDSIDQAKFDYAWWSTLLYGFDFMGWGEANDYSSWGPYSNKLLNHTRPDPGDIGSAFTSPAVAHNPPWHTRTTTAGAIKVNTDTHTGKFLLPGLPGLTQWLLNQQVPNTIVPVPASGRSGLGISYIIPSSAPSYSSIFGRSWIYDDALAVISWSMEGKFDAAIKALSAIAGLIDNDGKLGFSYNTNDSWFHPLYRTGAIAWAGYSIVFYQKASEDTQFQPAAVKIANWILTMQDPVTGSVKGGPDVSWFSTEHNIDAHFFLRDIGMLTGNTSYLEAANKIKNSLLSNHWNSSYGCFQQGIGDNTKVLDAASWGALFLLSIGELNKANSCLNFLETNFPTTVTYNIEGVPQTIKGYKPDVTTNLVWSEGSLGVAMAYQRSGNQAKYLEIVNEIWKMQGPNGGIIYAAPPVADFSNWEGVAGTAWMLMLQSSHQAAFWDAGYTPIGESVVSQPVDATTGTAPVTVTFDNVSGAGTTSLTTSSSGPQPPLGFTLGDPPIYYNLTTTALFSGSIAVCFDYQDIQVGDETKLKLFHFEETSWVDVTTLVDMTNNLIYGSVTSLSPFAIFEPCDLALGPIVAPIDPKLVNTEIQAIAQFTHSCPAAPIATWDWGDGTVSDGTIIDGTISGIHTYSQSGVYTIILSATHGITVTSAYQYIVIYDPDAGFVTGGGWIQSPQGAYTANPSLTEKANFVFVSKYQKGATVPTGNTKFQFKAGDLNFNSSSYDWLVITGAKAQYKGTGSINGVGTYKFHLTAIDADVNLNDAFTIDRFRIKIWDEGAGGENVVYDNAKGSDEDGDTTAIGGGSIMLHKEGVAKPAVNIIPTEFALFQNSPNPFNPTTTIQYAIPDGKGGMVRLTIYDSRGSLVRTLVDGVQNPGLHTATWNATDDAGRRISSGIYLYRLEAGSYTQSRKMLLLR